MIKHKDDDTDQLEDGVVAKVPMMFMDQKTVLTDGLPGGLHRPGYRYCSETPQARATRDAVYDSYNDDLCNRYKDSDAPGTVLDTEFDDSSDSGGTQDVYQEYDRHIQDAWKGE